MSTAACPTGAPPTARGGGKPAPPRPLNPEHPRPPASARPPPPASALPTDRRRLPATVARVRDSTPAHAPSVEPGYQLETCCQFADGALASGSVSPIAGSVGTTGAPALAAVSDAPKCLARCFSSLRSTALR